MWTGKAPGNHRIERPAMGTTETNLIQFPATEQPPRPMYVPAYCDPNNEVRGSKFQDRLSTVEIAKILRSQISQMIKSGELPKAKISVRTSHGNSLGISVSSLPANPYTRLYAAARNAGLDLYNTPWRGQVHTPEAIAILEKLEDMAREYRRDNSDISSDYFDCNFYLSVSLDWSWAADQLKALQASELSVPTIKVEGEYCRVNSYVDLTEV